MSGAGERRQADMKIAVKNLANKKVKDIEENLTSRRAFLDMAQKAAADFG